MRESTSASASTAPTSSSSNSITITSSNTADTMNNRTTTTNSNMTMKESWPAQDFVLKLFAKTRPAEITDATEPEWRRIRLSQLGGSIICWDTGACDLSADTYDQLLRRAFQNFAPTISIRLVYQDEDDDWVVIGSNEELADAITIALLTQPRRWSLSIGVERLAANEHEPGIFVLRGETRRAPTTTTHWNWMNVLVGIALILGLLQSRIAEIVSSSSSSTKDLREILKNDSSNSTNPSNTIPDGEAPDPYLVGVFSDVLDNSSSSSPLWKALEWVQKDPHWKRYPRDRLRQRFGLAAFYFATNDNGSDNGSSDIVLWKRSDDWLSYQIHECHWYPGSFTMSICGEDKHHKRNNDWQYQRLWLPNNGLEGTIPPQVFTLVPSLERIRLDRNIWLTGILPSTVGLLTGLQQLWMHHNMLSGTLPSELGQLSKLEKLCLAENNFVGTISPSMFDNLKSLRKLWLNDNDFTGPIPDPIGARNDDGGGDDDDDDDDDHKFADTRSGQKERDQRQTNHQGRRRKKPHGSGRNHGKGQNHESRYKSWTDLMTNFSKIVEEVKTAFS